MIGPLKKHIGRDVLVSELDEGDPVPLHSQVERELFILLVNNLVLNDDIDLSYY